MTEHQSAFPFDIASPKRDLALRPSLRTRWSKEQVRAAATVLLLLFWPWLGLFGREPWKPDEAYSFGLVWSIVQGKGLIVPLLAGEPFLEKPPLFYWVAAAFAELSRGWLPVHEGARLAVPFFLYPTLGFLAAAARELFGARRCLLGPALFVGSLGVFDKVHMLVTDVALVAGLAIALYGIAIARRRGVAGGVGVGIGAGVAFMSKGLLGPGLVAATLAVLLCSRAWRERLAGRFIAVAAAVGAPLLIAWPLALYVQSPALFHVWFWDNNIGRFVGFVRLGATHGPWFYPLTLLWFTFPAWPAALEAADAAWRQQTSALPLSLPGAALSVMVIVLMSAHESRTLYALPTALPMALLALPGLERTSGRWVARLRRSSIVVFAIAAALVWLAWLSAVSGFPQATASILAAGEPGFVARFSPAAAAVAALVTLLFTWIARSGRSGPAEALWTWTAGIAMCWGLVLSLWLPYLDYGMAYRSMAGSLQRALPRDHACVASRGLGEPQRAMLDYYLGLDTLRVETSAAARECPWMLLQYAGAAFEPPAYAYGSWEQTWAGARPGDDREKFALLHKLPSG